MDTPEQAALRESVRDFCVKHAGPGAWDRLTGELGLTGLAVAERYGGAGAGLAEVAVAVEETGRVLLPLPYLSTALAGAVLSEDALFSEAISEGSAAPGDGGAAGFLPGIASGELRAAFVFSDAVTASGGRLTGVARHVLDGAEAGLFVVRAGDALFAVRAADTDVTPAFTLDETRSQATVSFSGSPGVALRSASAGGAAERAEDLLRVMLAVESAGAAAHCLDVTVGYLKTRVQFGRPIGAFQALRHRCADLAVEVASARATAYAAVRAAASPAAFPVGAGSSAELAVLGPLAKRHCADVFWHVAAEMIQLHGGIGFTWAHEAHRYLKRAKTAQLLHGTPAELRRLVSQRAGLC
jgi:alkylation response protein AidB-like acyl-CoA dehydrogenase